MRTQPMSEVTFYEILEVSPNASQAVIRAAYKSLIQRYHPDKNSGSLDMEQKTILIGKAFEVLSDPETRKAYDKDLEQQRSNAIGELHKPHDAAEDRDNRGQTTIISERVSHSAQAAGSAGQGGTTK